MLDWTIKAISIESEFATRPIRHFCTRCQHCTRSALRYHVICSYCGAEITSEPAVLMARAVVEHAKPDPRDVLIAGLTLALTMPEVQP